MVRILMDVDGVCADFTGKILALANTQRGRWPRDDGELWREEHVTTWDVFGLFPPELKKILMRCVGAEGFANDLAPLPGAVEAVKELMEDHEVLFVTTPWRSSKTWVYDRNRWLVRHFGEAGKKVIHTSEKYAVKGDIFIDDKTENVKRWADEYPSHTYDAEVVLWLRTCNTAEMLVEYDEAFHTNDWEDVKDLARFCVGLR